MGAALDLAGQKFGRLTAIGRAPTVNRQTRWLCRCECGSETAVHTASLRAGLTRSCGCLMRETAQTIGASRATHGMREAPEYSVWCGIKRRCENPREKSFPNYGGRGVACRFESFSEFFAEIGPRPSKRHQVDRIDPNGHYERGNVRWVLPSAQQRNRRDARLITLNGETKPLKDWCEALSVPYITAYQRIARRGWSAERALGVGQ